MDDTVRPEGVELIPSYSLGSETFWRQLKFEEFDISAMSISSYLIAKSHGADMVGVPVFPSRRFMHTQLSYHVKSGIQNPGDVVGKRIGVEEYQMTAVLWTRGILEHDFGVSPYKVRWYMERTEELSHGGATGFSPPKGISFHRIPEDKSLASMLVNHELDVATVDRAFRRENNVIDRSVRIRGTGGDWTRVKPLFPDLVAEGTRFFKKHGYIPPNNIYIIKGKVDRKYPWLALNLYKAFVEAKELVQRNLERSIPSSLIFGEEYLRQTREIFGEDPYPYGIKENRNMIQTMIDFSYEQGLTARKLKIEDLFAPSTLDF